MIDSNIYKIDKINDLDVSRETLKDLEDYSKSIILKNKTINLISKSTEKSIKHRHIEDSAQTIEFIDKNDIKICTDLGSSRAFKPLPIIFQIALNNFKNFKYIILFLGKSGKKIFDDALKSWKFDYEEKKSLTNHESMIVKISNLRKKNV